MQSTASGLLLPDHAAQNYRRDMQVDEMVDRARGFNRLLRQIDDRLSLVWANEQADAPGLVPGRWHVRRRNGAGVPDTYMAILGEGGSYREPDSSILRELQKRDLWTRDGMRDLERRGDAEVRAREAAAERTRAERREEFRDRYKALDSPGVSFNVGEGFSVRAGKRKRKAAR